MQKLTNLLFELYLPLFWKNAEVCISHVFNQSIESLMFLSQWLETIYINKYQHESKSANNSIYWNI